MLPKIEPLRGALVSDWKTCGKAVCRCARGERHGPYWSLRWREDGRQRRTYVCSGDVDTVRAAVAAWRDQHPPARSARDLIADLRRLMRTLEV